MKYLLVIMFFACQLNAQDNLDSHSVKNTSLNLVLGPNVTYSSEPKSFSIGGHWGISLDHRFQDQPYGLSVGIHYNLIHIGDNGERFTPAAQATEFDILETSLSGFLIPFEELENFRIRLGISQGLIVGLNTFGLPGLNYNVLMGRFGMSYNIPTNSNLAAAVAWDYKYYKIYSDLYGFHITSVISLRLGIKT